MNNLNNVLFVSGIDTDAGKSYATGWLAKQLADSGKRVITQKFVQTGNVGYSEDINLHRRIMGIDYTEEDKSFLTMPEIYSYPASPHLSAEIDNRPVNLEKINHATRVLSECYDIVLLEGAGGLMVPLKRDYLTIDYIVDHNLPLVFVSSGKLGSINHTLLSLEAIKNRNITLHTLLYNHFPTNKDRTIQRDTREYIRSFLKQHFQETIFLEVPLIDFSK